jgi:hypothetical protein
MHNSYAENSMGGPGSERFRVLHRYFPGNLHDFTVMKKENPESPNEDTGLYQTEN